MSGPTGRATAVEVAPLSHRILAMSVFRVVLMGCFALLAARAHQGLTGFDAGVLVAYAVLVAGSLATLAIKRAQITARLFSFSLLIDAVLVQIMHERLGHVLAVDLAVAALLVVVCLLASYRTGLKIALWQSLLVVLAWRSEESGLFPTPEAMQGVSRDAVVMSDIVLLWLVTLATSIAGAINERELRRRRYDAEMLQRLAASLLKDDTPAAVVDRIFTFLSEELVLRRVAIVARQRSPQGAVLKVLKGRGLAPAPTADVVDSGLLERATQRQEPILALRLSALRDPFLTTVMPDARRVAAIPISLGRNDTAAVVEFDAKELRGGRVERRTVVTATQACAIAALALSRAELIEANRRDARVDALTGLANRRAFDAELAEASLALRTAGVPFALVLGDVDFFKKVNDVYGHQFGDDVLAAVARVLAGVVGTDGLAARYGGEEFALILRDVDPQWALHIADEARRAIEALTEPVPVTMSFGVVCATETDLPGDLLHRADTALYEAKRAGRNRVHAFDANPVPAQR